MPEAEITSFVYGVERRRRKNVVSTMGIPNELGLELNDGFFVLQYRGRAAQIDRMSSIVVSDRTRFSDGLTIHSQSPHRTKDHGINQLVLFGLLPKVTVLIPCIVYL